MCTFPPESEMRVRVRNIFSLLLGLIGCFSFVFGQIQLSQSSVDFGTVDELTPKTITIGLTNTSSDPIQVSEIRVYDNQYARTPFSTDKTSMTLAGGATDSLAITFAPVHNIDQNSEVLLITDGPEGHLSIDIKGEGEYSISYYDLTQNSAQEDLKQTFQTLLTFGHTQMGYNAGRTEMFMVIDNKAVNGQGASQNELECPYTGQVISGFTSRSAAQNMGFNTEHTFPQSLFGSSEPMVSDLHHLFPVNANANSQRGNKPFGTVSNPSWQVGGSKSNGSTFEPRDVHKGPVARAMIYFFLRYGDYNGFFAQQENVFRQWHNNFPPDAIQQKRNDDVQNGQGNRNPLTDYPQFIERIENLVGFSSQPIQHELDLSGTQIDFGTITWGPQQAATAEYTLVLVNHGNILESITDFQSSVPGISFAQPLGDTTLLPGQALPIRVQFSPTDSAALNGTFSFQTTAPGMDSVSISLTAAIDYVAPPFNLLPGTVEPPSPEGHIVDSLLPPMIFPNPVGETVHVYDGNLEGGSGEVLIYNLAGQKMFHQTLEFASNQVDVQVETFAEALYILEVRSGDYRKHHRLWVRH